MIRDWVRFADKNMRQPKGAERKEKDKSCGPDAAGCAGGGMRIGL